MRASNTAGAQAHGTHAAAVASRNRLPFAPKADRAKAYRAARRHTMYVKCLRILMPVAAIATLGFYVVNARLSASVGGVEASIEGVEFSTENLRMVSPKLEGVTDDNGRYVVTAAAGTQKFDAPDIIMLEKIDARLTQPNSDWAHLIADTGRFETKTDKMDLNGNIRLVAHNGMDARMKSARIDIKAQRVVSEDPVRVDMPNGHIDSDAVLIDTGRKQVSFVGRVKVRLFKRPQADGSDVQ